MIVPNPNYRLNPGRAIFVSGMINKELVSKLTPEIVRLLDQSREPITVYIDSPGGVVAHAETILKLLKFPDQNLSPPCQIITAVTTQAASAAADLLSSGDYATAYPTSSILYHGLRTYEEGPLTSEKTSMLANLLRASNDIYAKELAAKVEHRFCLRYVYARFDFDDIRAEKQIPQETDDVQIFTDHFIPEKLSPGALKLWNKARGRYSDYQNLFTAARKKMLPHVAGPNPAMLEAVSIKAIIDYELKRNKKNPAFRFRNAGIVRLAEDFFLLDEYLTGFEGIRLRKWCENWGRYILSQSVREEIDAIQDEKQRTDKLVEEVSPLISPLLAFFSALCHALQEGENQLTARDAYWLGLVDEVIGVKELMSLRMIEEFKSDEAEKKSEESKSREAAD